jgi:hypothetical protein
MSHFVDSCQMSAYAKWLDGKREKKKCVSCWLWSFLKLKAKISASSNVTVRVSDFTSYSLIMSHANRPKRDRVKCWDSRRIRIPSPVASCYESLESTTVHTKVCQWIQSWASCTHFQPSTNFWSIRPSAQQRRLLCLPINCFLRCSSTKILCVFLASPSELTARNCNLDNFIAMTILSDSKISCNSSSRGTPIDLRHLKADASWIGKKYLFFQFRVSGGSVNEDEWATQNFWMEPIYNFRYSSTSW